MSPRPSSALRLADLDPREVANEVVGMLCDHLSRQALFALHPGHEFRLPAETAYGGTQLGFTAALLTLYAKTGRAGDWEDDAGCAVDGIQSVCEALYSQAGVPGTFDIGALSDQHPGIPEEPIGLVLVGAHARVKLSSPAEPGVTPRELAVLAGVTDHQIRHLARAGELELEDGIVPRKAARRWLGARGVPGFEARKKSPA